jgi:tetratricopeptide (TPR) repeat protein
MAAGFVGARLLGAGILNGDAGEQTLRFLEARVRRDPEDFIAHNKLAGYYMQRLRETGDLVYLDLATRSARASLAALPAEHNTGGLAVLTQVEFAGHDFQKSRDDARRLTQVDSGKGYPYMLLGDALLELGRYDEARVAFARMNELGGLQGITRVAAAQRVARMALLHGDVAGARRAMTTALREALALPVPPRETIAWCRWQLGEIAFSIGDYAGAETHARDALTTFPGYFRGLAELARSRAARGDRAGAITEYRNAIAILPDPSYVAALGDLYAATGRDKEAAGQYALVEQIGRLAAASGTLHNRQLAIYYADHDLKPAEAYSLASKDYEVRRDIYGADTLAWTALKAGRLKEAQAAIREARRLGTRDAKIEFHAGLIARAAGDREGARRHLRRALEYSPAFDVRGAAQARAALEAL